MNVFVDSLTLSEMNELSNVIYNKKREYARKNMKPIHSDELLLVEYGYYIPAIKEYRYRTGCSLLEAKIAIDSVRG